MKKRPRRKLSGREAAEAIGNPHSIEADDAWAALHDEVEDEDRLDALVKRFARKIGLRVLPDPD